MGVPGGEQAAGRRPAPCRGGAASPDPAMRSRSGGVVIPALQDFDALIHLWLACDPIDEPVLPGDPPRPPAGQITLQALRLPEPFERRPHGVLKNRIQTLENGTVCRNPVLVVIPTNARETHDHRASGATR